MLKISLKLSVAQLVTTLVSPIRFSLFLHSIVGQVHHAVIKTRNIEQLRTSAHVPLLVPVKLKSAFNRQSHHKSSDVKFSAVVQEKIFYIGLNYDLPVLCQRCPNLVERSCTFDSSPSIGVLCGLNNPNTSFFLALKIYLLELSHGLRLFLFYVVGLWQYKVDALLFEVAVLSDVVQKGVFVPEHVVTFVVIVHYQRYCNRF